MNTNLTLNQEEREGGRKGRKKARVVRWLTSQILKVILVKGCLRGACLVLGLGDFALEVMVIEKLHKDASITHNSTK